MLSYNGTKIGGFLNTAQAKRDTENEFIIYKMICVNSPRANCRTEAVLVLRCTVTWERKHPKEMQRTETQTEEQDSKRIQNQWAVNCTLVKSRFYQFSLSNGFTEGHSPAVHQDPALLPHRAVGALSPVRRGRRVTRTKRREGGAAARAPTRRWSPALPGGWSRSRRAARRAWRGAPLSMQQRTHAHRRVFFFFECDSLLRGNNVPPKKNTACGLTKDRSQGGLSRS